MLLAAAGLPSDSPHQSEAKQIVDWCNYLPLAISITGRMLKEHVSDVDDDDWSWVLTHMQEEFAGPGGQAKSAEESVISTSLSAIRGANRESILALFSCLALCPEDTSPPLEGKNTQIQAFSNACFDRFELSY